MTSALIRCLTLWLKLIFGQKLGVWKRYSIWYVYILTKFRTTRGYMYTRIHKKLGLHTDSPGQPWATQTPFQDLEFGSNPRLLSSILDTNAKRKGKNAQRAMVRDKRPRRNLTRLAWLGNEKFTCVDLRLLGSYVNYQDSRICFMI